MTTSNLFPNDPKAGNKADNTIEVSGYLFNNPKFHLFHELPYRTFDCESFPHIHIELVSRKELPVLKLNVKVLDQNKNFAFEHSTNITLKGMMGTFDIPLESPIRDPAEIVIEVSGENTSLRKSIPIKMVKMHGKVTDFDGRPIKNAWIVVLDYRFDQMVVSDKEGNYVLYLPEGDYNCIAALTRLYPTDQLENYIWNLPLYEDLQYDFILGRAEVFRLMASSMSQNSTISGSFIAWTTSDIRRWMATKKTAKYEMDEELLSAKYTPRLSLKDVKFYLDGIRIQEIPLFERANVLFPPNKIAEQMAYRFEFFIPQDVPKKRFYILRVEIEHETINAEGKKLVERGQASLHNLMIF